MQFTESKPSSWLDQPVIGSLRLTWEQAFWLTILVLAIFSRVYLLGARVMSHDENSHVYYSWRFFQGQGFSHDPLMHGPLQFHLLAASYFMFGDNDFTGRLPQALCSVATVMFMWFYRRYLGRAGAMIAAVLMLISPYMMYYGRYARNEAFVALFGVIMLWAMLRYLETGQIKYMYWVTAANVLHFTSKETSFIYSAQAMIFLAFYFIYRITRVEWPKPEFRNRFLLALIVGIIFLGLTGGYWLLNRPPALPEATATPRWIEQRPGAIGNHGAGACGVGAGRAELYRVAGRGLFSGTRLFCKWITRRPGLQLAAGDNNAGIAAAGGFPDAIDRLGHPDKRR